MSDGINHSQKINYCNVCGFPKGVCRCLPPPPWPPVLFSPPGYGGDWSKTPLGEILDGNEMQESGYTAKCLKYNCQCDMEHL